MCSADTGMTLQWLYTGQQLQKEAPQSVNTVLLLHALELYRLCQTKTKNGAMAAAHHIRYDAVTEAVVPKNDQGREPYVIILENGARVPRCLPVYEHRFRPPCQQLQGALNSASNS